MDILKPPFRNFNSYRHGQKDIIDFAVNSDKKFVLLSLPTGVGKTLCSMAASSNYSKSVYTVQTKMLQEQINNDFPEAIVLKGRSNYPCPRFAEFDFKADHCVKRNCLDIGDCQYEITKNAAIRSKYKVLNFPYFLSETNLAKGSFSEQELVVLDEADHTEQSLVDFIALTLTKYNIQTLKSYGLEEPLYRTKQDSWKDWAKSCLTRLKGEMNSIEPSISHRNPNMELLKKYNSLKRLVYKFEILRDYANEKWIRYETDGKVIFRPVWLSKELAERFLYRHADKFILMSATFPAINIFCKLMGLDICDVDYIDVPSPFPSENRPVIYEDVADMSYKAFEVGKLVNRIKEILKQFKHEKGIIHCASYKMRSHIMSIMDDRFITHESNDKEEVIAKFKKSKEPLVLVSPSVERGVSFNDDMCRFIILAKVPYQSLTDRIVSARLYSGSFGSMWYSADAAQRVVQSCGRGVRHETDFCTSFILDKQFSRLIKSPRLFPAYFREALRL